ncbi:MAG: sensor histidine kinase [Anaerolineae bacterium]
MLAKTQTSPIPQVITRPLIRWLAVSCWVVFILLHLALLTLDMSRDYPIITTPCVGEVGFSGACRDQLALSPAEITVLESWGWSLEGYATYMFSWIVIEQIIGLTVGLFILWHVRASWLGLTISLLVINLAGSYYGGDEFGSIHPALTLPANLMMIVGTFSQIAFLYLMPNGRFFPRWAPIPMMGTMVLFAMLNLNMNSESVPNWFVAITNQAFTGLLLLGIGLQVYRYAKISNQVERQQAKWVIFGVIVFALTIFLWILTFGGGIPIPSGRPLLLSNLASWTLISLGGYFFPIAILIAILRYRVWNIDIIISRALIYGGLTLMIIAIYSITVGGFSLLFQTSGNFLVSLIATGLIAVVFQPLRERLQRWINRLIFGERDDPYTVISQLNQSLQATTVPQETLTTIAQTIVDMLKLPHVALELIDDDIQIGLASVGKPVGTPLELPLTYQKENVGRLTVSPRTPNDPFNPQEEKLLADIAAQIGPVASATRLTMALQRSRENLVLAREEERRRIRRDLHDGLGPTLASQTLKLDSVLELMTEGDVNTAGRHLKELKGQTQQMVADIRRLVYELRPPALDELGLLQALRAHFGQSTGSRGQLTISIGAEPEPLPELPAAIEVAAYRTILEAVTNVVRHAKANNCNVQLSIEESNAVSRLHVSVEDDGIGLPEKRMSGVGLISMRERAEELGGRFAIKQNSAGGTQITSVFPFTMSHKLKRINS